jgi:hypothetical protein
VKTTSDDHPPYRRRRPRAVPVLLLTTWSLVGCYRYVPVAQTPNDPVTGRVILVLNPRGSESVRGVLGENMRRIDGVVSRSTNDSLYLRADYTQSLTGEKIPNFGTPVTVARADLLSFEIQRYSKKRSWLFVGALTAVVVAAISSIRLGSSGGAGENGPTPPPT